MPAENRIFLDLLKEQTKLDRFIIIYDLKIFMTLSSYLYKTHVKALCSVTILEVRVNILRLSGLIYRNSKGNN